MYIEVWGLGSGDFVGRRAQHYAASQGGPLYEFRCVAGQHVCAGPLGFMQIRLDQREEEPAR